MAGQIFADMPMAPPSAALPTITATTETALFPTIFTPIPAWAPRVGSVWLLTVAGTATTGTAGTLTITPRFGTVIGGVALGTSPVQNYVPSITLAPFLFQYWIQFRTIQIAAASATSTMIGWGRWSSGGAVATASSETSVTLAPASASVDVSAASALWIGVTFSVAPSVIPQTVLWQSLGFNG
jgi:hypothetical protein